MENTFVVNYIIDPSENGSYSFVDNTNKNVATLVISDENLIVYFENGNDPIDFEKDTQSLLEYITDNEWKVSKLMKTEHRWHKYNPNPKSRNIGDCTLRSYCAAFDISWEQAFDIASNIAKENASLVQYVAQKVLKEYFNCTQDEDYKKTKAKNRMTVNEFTKIHPYGTYILQTRGHQVTVKDGEYWDSWDSGDKKVSNIFYLPKEKENA